MYRRTFTSVLTTAAIAVGILGIVGYSLPVFHSYRLTGRLNFYVYFHAGLARLYFFHTSEDVHFRSPDNYIHMSVHRDKDGAQCHRYRHAPPGRITPHALLSTSWVARRSPPPFPTMHLFGVRTWAWVPVALLLAFPIWSVADARIRQRKRRPGFCDTCGYDLTGNISGRCPECGEQTGPASAT